MNFDDRGAIIGMILGDGCLRIRKRYEQGREHQKQVLFQCSHSIKQLPYAKDKSQRLDNILGGRSKMAFYDVVLKGRNIPYKMCRFVKVNKYFDHLRGWLYSDGKKVITSRFLDWMSEEGLAYWFSDDGWSDWWKRVDGSITSVQSGLAICRPVSECDLVLCWLQQKYNISGKIGRSNNNNMLRFNTQDALKLHAIVAPYTSKCMLYKINSNYVSHEHQPSGKLKSKPG